MAAKASGITKPKRAAARCWFSKLPAPFHVMPGRQWHHLGHRSLGVIDKAHQVATIDIGLHQGKPRTLFAPTLPDHCPP